MAGVGIGEAPKQRAMMPMALAGSACKGGKLPWSDDDLLHRPPVGTAARLGSSGRGAAGAMAVLAVTGRWRRSGG